MALIVGGLFKKVVFANATCRSPSPIRCSIRAGSQFGGGDILLAVVAYAFQIYFDFSAYTDIAIGVAALLGYRFPENFNQPYRSLSPREFWTRWHISLSTSRLREYLYIPLGGSRHGMPRTIINLMITMAFGGLWHGANWTFVIWGAMHGVALVLNHLWIKTRLRNAISGAVIYKALCLVLMAIFICATWVFFRSPDLQTASDVFGGIAQRFDAPTLLTPFLGGLLVIGVLDAVPADRHARWPARPADPAAGRSLHFLGFAQPRWWRCCCWRPSDCRPLHLLPVLTPWPSNPRQRAVAAGTKGHAVSPRRAISGDARGAAGRLVLLPGGRRRAGSSDHCPDGPFCAALQDVSPIPSDATRRASVGVAGTLESRARQHQGVRSVSHSY